MPQVKEFGLALLLNLFLFLFLIWLIYPFRHGKDLERIQNSVIEYQRLDPQSFAAVFGAQSGEIEKIEMPVLSDNIVPELESSSDYAPPVPEESEIIQWNEPSRDSFSMPDPLFNEIFEDIPENERIGSGEVANWDNIEFQWMDGSNRDILYIPGWNDRIDREMDNSIKELRIRISITGEGYIFDPKLEDRISLNSAWENLVLNWISQFVFEPGEEGEGAITIKFVPVEL